MRAYEMFLGMEQLQDLQENIINELGKTMHASERERLGIHLDRVSADWLFYKHQLDRIPQAKEIIETIRELKIEQIEVSNKLGKAVLPFLRKRYEDQLDMMLADITELKHKLEII